MRRKKNTFIDLLENYFSTYIPVSKGLSPSTLESYKATFRILMEFMHTVKGVSPEKVSFEALDTKTILDFLDWLESERKCSVTTRNQRLSALCAFSVYAQNRDFTAASSFRNSLSKIPKKRTSQSMRSFFSRDEVKILLGLPDERTETGLRNKTLLCFMYASGMRAQEVCNLTVGDVQFLPDRASIRVRGKGQKIRRIGIPAATSEMLKRYITHRGISMNAGRHIFSSQTHEQMTISCIEEIYSKYVSIAKQENPELFRDRYSPHSMRHTTATHMLEAGVPLIVVKNFLGHVSLQTTQIYAQISQETMNRQLKAWNDKWFLKDDVEQLPSKKNGIIPDFLR